MSRRAIRRHHEERVKRSKRSIAKRWAGPAGAWVNKVDVTWSGLGTPRVVTHRRAYVDRRGAVERLKFIERVTNALAHHNKCPCGMCKRDRYDRRRDLPPVDTED